MSFSTYAEGGDTTLPDYPYYIYIYPNTLGDASLLDSACDGAVDMCEQLYNYNAIDFYSVRQYDGSTGYPNGSTSGACDCRSDFRSWAVNNGYDQRVGTHCVIDDDFGGGCIGKSDTESTNSFNVSRFAACGFPWESEGQATVIHEALHSLIIDDEVVGSDWDDLAPDNEHQLGKVYNDGTGEASPMVNNAPKAASNAGDCSTNLAPSSERNEMTFCEKEGVYRSAREVFN